MTVPSGSQHNDPHPIEPHPIEDKYNFHEASFRRHYQLNYRDEGNGFEFYEPAYNFGYELAAESPGVAWERVMPAAERHWRANHRGDWSTMVNAVHYGWLEQRDPDALRVHHDEQYENYRARFEAHHLAEMGDAIPFEQYEHAYRRGYDMAVDPTFRTHLWAEVEPEVRNYYESEYAGSQLTWDRYHNAVYHAWHQVRT